MKKQLILLFMVVFFAAGKAQTQLEVVRVDASVGLFPTHEELLLFSMPQAFLYAFSSDYRTASPTLFAGINFLRINDVELGIEFGYQSDYTPGWLVDDPPNLSFVDSLNPSQVYSLMPRFRMTWLETEDHFLELYSSLSAGLCLIHEGGDVNLYYPEVAAHVSLVGISIGSELRGFIEFGMGNKGLMLAGLSYSP